MKRKYALSRRLAYALVLEAIADEVDDCGGIVPLTIAYDAGGTDEDAARIQDFREQIVTELRQRAAKIRARLSA